MASRANPYAGPAVYYVGAFRFPDGDAAAARVLGVGKALREMGAGVVFGGWERAGRPEDLQPSGHYEHQGFRYVSQGELRHEPLPLIKRALRQVTVGVDGRFAGFGGSPCGPGMS